MDEFLKRIGAVVPVIRLDDVSKAARLAGALTAGGIPVAEITFRAAGADRAIAAMREAFPDMTVGAGTVLTKAQIDRALAAGAQFIVSPGFNPANVAYCAERGVPVFPGCVTPTEIEAALAAGLSVVKFFPASAYGGVETIKALAAPFQTVKFMPTGGISLSNLAEYLKCPAVAACGGSYMVAPKLIEGGEWEQIERLCRESVSIVREVRGNG